MESLNGISRWSVLLFITTISNCFVLSAGRRGSVSFRRDEESVNIQFVPSALVSINATMSSEARSSFLASQQIFDREHEPDFQPSGELARFLPVTWYPGGFHNEWWPCHIEGQTLAKIVVNNEDFSMALAKQLTCHGIAKSGSVRPFFAATMLGMVEMGLVNGNGLRDLGLEAKGMQTTTKNLYMFISVFAHFFEEVGNFFPPLRILRDGEADQQVLARIFPHTLGGGGNMTKSLIAKRQEAADPEEDKDGLDDLEYMRRITEVINSIAFTTSVHRSSPRTPMMCCKADVDGRTHAACYFLDMQRGSLLLSSARALPSIVSQIRPAVLLTADTAPPPPPKLNSSVLRGIKAEAIKQRFPLVCMGTWNAGSENKHGMGTGAAAASDYMRGLGTLTRRCAGADFIALTVQEADQVRTIDYVTSLMNMLNNRSDLDETIRKAPYKLVGLVWAESKDDEEEGVIHSVPPIASEQDAQTISEGVVLAVLARENMVYGAAEGYTVKVTDISAINNYVRKNIVQTTAHKAGAVIKITARMPFEDENGNLLFGMNVPLELCFGGVHLDAKNFNTRTRQANMVVETFRQRKCDVAVLAGDFNARTRQGRCCPWAKIENLVNVGAHTELIQLLSDNDEIQHDWKKMSWWNGFQEAPINFMPSFHKRFSRTVGRTIKTISGDVIMSIEEKVRDQCGKYCAVGPNCTRSAQESGARSPVRAMPVGDVRGPLGEAVVDHAGLFHSYKKYFLDEAHDQCDPPNHRDSLCWQGRFDKNTCLAGLCYNIHDKSHCPGFTDRVVWKGFQLSGGMKTFKINFGHHFYTALEEVSTADHTPVVALLSVKLQAKVTANAATLEAVAQKQSDEPTLEQVTSWLTRMEDPHPRTGEEQRLRFANGSGKHCYRNNPTLGWFSSTGCPSSESCFRLATTTDGTHGSVPDAMCERNDPETHGVCASNRDGASCLVTVPL